MTQTGTYEHGNEFLGKVKGRKFPDQLSEYQLLKEDSVLFGFFVNGLADHTY
jgi:hypothetical protein